MEAQADEDRQCTNTNKMLGREHSELTSDWNSAGLDGNSCGFLESQPTTVPNGH